ncbi:GGDEF domain-containing protein [uncultured Halomonas sp.]|uniref:GGDEF domain-containing protein n=1 Tax=uncultured Halomonas sp. TaxID=173971 RepID=UPI002635FFBF|nr:GGDEF domain-containing protein [uncultured Halomonas sp.]
MRPSLALLLSLLCLLVAPGVTASPPPSESLTGWEWRWGDAPLDATGTPTWLNDNSSDGWHPIAFPSNPPGRQGYEHLWIRTLLPEGEWRDPVLYIYSIDLIAQFYLDGELLYQYGEFDEQGRGSFSGWPWHMIELPDDFGGKTLHIRVFSDYTDIGLWGEAMVLDRLDLLALIMKRSWTDVVISAFSLLLALLAGGFALIGAQRQSLGAVALFSLAASSMIFAETQASQLLINRPLLWDGLAAGGYFTLPVGMGLLLAHWLTGTPRRVIQAVWRLHLVYLIAATGLSQSGMVSIASTFPPFDLLLAVTLPTMLSVSAMDYRRLDAKQRWIIVSFAIMAVLLLADMAVAHGLVSWRKVPVSLGLLIFSLAIVGVSLWHYRHTQHQLTRLNQHLEEQVRERTTQLDSLVSKLEGFSYEDSLTGLKNRRYFNELMQHETTRANREGTPLSLIMMDLDHFKRINDRYGHAVGDTVLVSVARLLREHFRNADVVCRLGGEEFVALLPGATTERAEMRAQELIKRVRKLEIQYAGTVLPPITLSCGVATYPCHAHEPIALLGLADKALYQAKHQGRDRSTTWNTVTLDSPPSTTAG